MKESKEAKEQARIEIESLKKARQDLSTDKMNMEQRLLSEGQRLKDLSQ